MAVQDLENRFTYHPPKPGQAETYQGIRGDSREKSLSLTSLEETVMWANAAIARNG